MDTTSQPKRWSQEQRLEFIDYRLYWDGRINRCDLTSFFSISIPQASLDLARYIETASTNLLYDKKKKVYLATPQFKPAFITPDAHAYLNEIKNGNPTSEKETVFSGWIPPVESIRIIHRAVNAETLKVTLHAIRYQQKLEICYQSLNRPEPVTRKISPHALAFDGQRWHIRAFCHLREKFQDFVFARILNYRLLEEQFQVHAETDVAWNTVIQLELAPNPALTDLQKQVICYDYGMNDKHLSITIRSSLLLYVIQHLNLWPGVLSEHSKHAEQFKQCLIQPHFVLTNKEALLPELEKIEALVEEYDTLYF